MKPYFVALLLLASCMSDSPEGKSTSNADACPEISEPQFAAAGKQARVYYTVPGFNPKSKQCWAALHEAAKHTAVTGDDPAIIAFIDAEDFTPGKDGMYDNNEKVRQQVVAQVLVNKPMGLFEFTPDPFALGKYTEPK